MRSSEVNIGTCINGSRATYLSGTTKTFNTWRRSTISGPSIGVWGTAGAAIREVGVVQYAIADGGAGGASCSDSGDSGASEQTRGVAIF